MAAREAFVLKTKGFRHLLVLKGGLEAWKKAGFPVAGTGPK